MVVVQNSFFFSLIILFAFLFDDIQSAEFCERDVEIPKEGFKRKNCIPGHYDGSCLLIFSKKVSFYEAYGICHYEYGGRLATADSEMVLKKWIKRIHRDSDFKVNDDTRFWVGYGRESFYEAKINDTNIEPFYVMVYWNKAFLGRNLTMNLTWENNADLFALDGNECSLSATVFNPNNAKFDVRPSEEEHPFLCETPRYPKFKCSRGWHLIPDIRVCVFVGEERKTFPSAVESCQRKEGFLLILVNLNDVDKVNAITAQHGLGNTYDNLWSGVKAAETKVYTLDGSTNIFGLEPGGNPTGCLALYGKRNRFPGGMQRSCYFGYPYLCQKFVDQAFTLNTE